MADDSDLMRLDDVLAALGHGGSMEHYDDEIALVDVVGTVARATDFDADFTPRRRDARWLRTEELFRNGSNPPPIDVVRLGDNLLFVNDGHHRVSVARSLGWDSLPARVRRICTVAFALCCLRVAHLPTKAAERRFLQKVPLPDEVTRDLWLDRPADWARLADAALAWGYTHQDAYATGCSAHDLGAAWWNQEVQPLVAAMRREGAGASLSDVQLFVTALAARDRLGALDWPSELLAADPEASCCHREIELLVDTDTERSDRR